MRRKRDYPWIAILPLSIMLATGAVGCANLIDLCELDDNPTSCKQLEEAHQVDSPSCDSTTSVRFQSATVPYDAAAIRRGVAALKQATTDDQRCTAIANLTSMGEPAVWQLIPLLKSKQPKVLVDAITIIGKLEAEGRSSVPYLIPLLQDRRAWTRLAATEALWFMGSDAEAAIPQLIPLLKDPNMYVRIEAARTLASIGKAAKTALIPMLQHSDVSIRANAAMALAQMEEEAKDALPSLIVLLKTDTNRQVQLNTIEALGMLRSQGAAAVPHLIPRLYDPDPTIHSYTVRALLRIGPAAKPAIPHLKELLKSANPSMRDDILTAIATIEKPPPPVPKNDCACKKDQDSVSSFLIRPNANTKVMG
jgi:HEAT repeat protein